MSGIGIFWEHGYESIGKMYLHCSSNYLRLAMFGNHGKACALRLYQLSLAVPFYMMASSP